MSTGHPGRSHVEPTVFGPPRFAWERGETGARPGDAVATVPRRYRGGRDRRKRLFGLALPKSTLAPNRPCYPARTERLAKLCRGSGILPPTVCSGPGIVYRSCSMSRSRLSRRLLLLICLVLSAAATAAEDCAAKSDPCGKRTEWNEFETVRLRMTQTGSPGVMSSFLQTSRENNDLRVDLDITGAEKPQHGTILMVGGRVFASKGIALEPGAEIDALDGPVLYTILTTKILGRALPAGPGTALGPQKFSHRDETTGIQFATPSAEGFIPPPWSVAGTVTPKADHSVDFDFVLKWSAVDASKTPHPLETRLSGSLQHDKSFRLDDGMPLNGWTVLGVGPIMETTSSGTHIDYGTKPSTGSPHSIGDIRQQLAIEDSPGKADLSRNFAGFWKEKCSDSSGLRIRPVDQPGMYTVTFCGPGGCGDEQEERKTFITGDRHYTLTTAGELQVGPEGNRSTYRKCSDRMLP